ncbi:MAG: penicillin-binding transpeptidase domain-containing protein [Myxococcota bacterium]|nr:penicillin-binding transpeptidase domain-containing protein [Myxococcota bacterium]
MILEMLSQRFDLTAPQAHLVFLAAFAVAAVLCLLMTLLSLLRRADGGWPMRVAALSVVALSAMATQMAADIVGLDVQREAFSSTGIAASAWCMVVLVSTVAVARSAVLMASAHGMLSLGTVVYLVLIRSVPEGVDPSWELARYADATVFLGTGHLLLLAVGFLSAKRQHWGTRLLYGSAVVGSILAMIDAIEVHPRPGMASYALLMVSVAGSVWVAWWWRPRRGAREASRWLRRLGARYQEHTLSSVMLFLMPLLVGMLGLLLGSSGSAREASRISLFGLEFSPALMVPFLFALAVGYFVGREEKRYSFWIGLALSALMAGLLLAQKEVGNAGVILLTAAVVLLVARGTLLQLALGGGIGMAAVALAYVFAPTVEAVPYTFRERIQLWLGGAEMMYRGGSLVASSHITYDLGGFWGIGVHQAPGLNLHSLLVALDTDFPLTTLGLSGGWLLLSAFVVFFSSFAIAMLVVIRRMSFDGDLTRARRQLPILAALWTVPVASTAINIAGAITQLTPFTGVPVAFVSYSSTFMLGTFASLAAFVVVANRDRLRADLRARAMASVPQQRRRLFAEQETGQGAAAPAEARRPMRWWRAWLSIARHLRYGAWGLARLRLQQRLRLRSMDSGVLVLVVLLAGVAVAAERRLYERYTDTARYYSHPRLSGVWRFEPQAEPDAALRWRLSSGPDVDVAMLLEEGQSLRMETLLMRFRKGRLEQRGYCFEPEQWAQGVRIGFAGMLDAPELPWVGGELGRRLSVLSSPLEKNQVVLPFGQVAMQHARIEMVEAGRYKLTPLRAEHTVLCPSHTGELRPHPSNILANSQASVFVRYADFIEALTAHRGELSLGEELAIGAVDPIVFRIEAVDNAVCLVSSRSLSDYPLSTVGPTVLGDTGIRRKRLGRVTVDFEFVERVKLLAERGALLASVTGDRIWVQDYSPEAREAWDEDFRKLFLSVFDIVQRENGRGERVEGLAWRRPFYSDGGRAFDGRRELDAFVIADGRVLGLADSMRFGRVLPTGRDPLDPERLGRLLDRNGRPLTELMQEERRIRSTMSGGGALLGYAFEDSATRDGLLRVFAPLLAGVEPAPDPRAELEDLLAGQWRGAWGWDVRLSLDLEVQEAVFDILEDEVRKLKKKAPFDLHHGSIIVLGPGNEIYALAQMPDTGRLETVLDVSELKRLQRERPMQAAALDVFNRRTTLGSTIKLITLMTAFRHPEDALLEVNGKYYIDARKDGANAVSGRFSDRALLSSWRGRPITPIQNYQGEAYGKVISVEDMVVHSVNTAAAYLGLNVGKEKFLEFFELTGLDQSVDLLPRPLSADGPFGHLIQRYPRDAATALPAAVAVIPENERWTLSYTARLPLSGTSDYSIFTLAAAVSAIARDGVYLKPRIVSAIQNRKSLERVDFEEAEQVRVFSPEAAEQMTHYMEQVIYRGTAKSFRRATSPEIWKKTGGKPARARPSSRSIPTQATIASTNPRHETTRSSLPFGPPIRPIPTWWRRSTNRSATSIRGSPYVPCSAPSTPWQLRRQQAPPGVATYR